MMRFFGFDMRARLTVIESRIDAMERHQDTLGATVRDLVERFGK